MRDVGRLAKGDTESFALADSMEPVAVMAAYSPACFQFYDVAVFLAQITTQILLL